MHLFCSFVIFFAGMAIASAQRISTVAGGGVGDGGPATSAVVGATGVWVAEDGTLYIAEGYSDRIRKVEVSTGIISTVAGTGERGFSGDGGLATSAALSAPTNVWVDGEGNIYFAEYDNHRIRKVDAATDIITTVAGTGGKGFVGDGGPATSARLNKPYGLYLDSHKDLNLARRTNLYIADTENHRIRKVDMNTGIISTVAGTGVQGYAGDGGPATRAQLGDPHGVAVDKRGNLYIAESFGQVRKVDVVTRVITTVAGTGGSALRGIFVDEAGNLYIADSANHRIRKVDMATGIVSTVAGTGFYGPLGDAPWIRGDGGPATSAELIHPSGVFVDRAGNLYLADGFVRKVEAATGIISTIAGGGIGDGVLATSALVVGPKDILVDNAGNLYIADNNRIRKVDAATGLISTIAGGGSRSFPDANGKPATEAHLTYTTGICLDSAGNLYIADEADHRVYKAWATTGLISTFAGTGTGEDIGDGGPALLARMDPSRVFADKNDNLYIADIDNGRIRKVDVATGIIATIAGTGAGTGVFGFTGDGGPATSAHLSQPRGLFVDGAGNLYFADTYNHCIRKVDAATGIIATVAGTGKAGFSGDGGPAILAKLTRPEGIAMDGAGNLYIADSANDRIRRVDVETGIITTVAGRIRGFWGDGGPAADARFWSPEAICIDKAGNLYIADANNHRVRRVEGIAAPSPITAVLEENSSPAPQRFTLAQNYPNPFNTSTLIRFRVPASLESTALRLAIYDLTGQLVYLLAEGIADAGEQQLVWDGRDGAGRKAASGVYVYRLETKGFAVSRRMLLLR